MHNVNPQTGGSLYANTFYDSDDTNYYINAGATSSNSTSHSARFRQSVWVGDSGVYNQNDGGWGARLIVSDQVHSRIDVAQDANAVRASWFTHTGQLYSTFGTVTGHNMRLLSHNATRQILHNGYSAEQGSYRAPIFYDSNDTSFQVDPNSTSNFLKIKSSSAQTSPRWDTAFYVLQSQHWYGDTSSQDMFLGESGNNINVRGSITASGGQGAINITNSSILSAAASSWTGDPGANGKIQYHSNRWYIVSDSSSNRIVQFRRNGADKCYIDNDGRLLDVYDVRAYLYYDRDNTSYYVDPASTSNLNGLTVAGTITGTIAQSNKVAITGYQTNGFSFYQTSGSFAGNSGWANYFIGNHGDGSNYYNTTIIFPFWGPPKYSRLENNSFNGVYQFLTDETNHTTGYILQSNASLRAPIFYDSNNTSFYTDPSSTSILHGIQFSFTQHGSANNIRMGNSSTMNAISSGTNNAAFGVEALGACSTGSRNFAYGYASLYSLSSGGSNIAMGDATGYNVTSGSNNLLFGQNAGRTGYQSPYQSIAGVTSGSNQIHMGNESHTTARIQISWTVNSDARDKTDVNPLDLGLEFVKKLNPVTYRWDKRSDYEDRTPDGTNKLPELTLGFLAQEVEVIEKSFGYDVADKTNLVVDRIVDQDHYGITYEKMVPVLTKAIQEQQAIIDDLKSRLETLENQ